MNHPLLKNEVDFEPCPEEEDGSVLIRSPGLGPLYFEKRDIFVDDEDDDGSKDPTDEDLSLVGEACRRIRK